MGSNPIAIALTPDGSQAYISNEYDGTISVINTSANTVSATISLGSSAYPLAVTVTPDNSKAYVANSNNNTVAVIKTASDTVLPVGDACNFADKAGSCTSDAGCEVGYWCNDDGHGGGECTNSGTKDNTSGACTSSTNCEVGYGCTAGSCLALTLVSNLGDSE